MVLWTEHLERIDNRCTCMPFACVSVCHIHRGPSLFITSYNLVASPTKTKACGTFLRQLVHSVQSKLSGNMKLSRFYSESQRGTFCSVSRAQIMNIKANLPQRMKAPVSMTPWMALWSPLIWKSLARKCSTLL